MKMDFEDRIEHVETNIKQGLINLDTDKVKENIILLMKLHSWDLATVKVYLNDMLIPKKDLSKYKAMKVCLDYAEQMIAC